MTQPSFTGITRRRTSSALVRFGDRAARTLITIGGAGTILAVAMVCAFLVWVVLPLFSGAKVEATATVALPAAKAGLLHQSIDDYQEAAWQLFDDGSVRAVALRSGQLLGQQQAFDPQLVSAVTAHDDKLLLGLRDGRVRFVKLGFSAEFVDDAALPSGMLPPTAEHVAVQDGVIFSRTPEGQCRRQTLQLRAEELLPLANTAVLRVDYADGSNGPVLVAVTDDLVVHLCSIREQEDMMTGETHDVLSGGQVTLEQLGGARAAQLPDRIAIMGTGNTVLLVWNDGNLLRLDARDFEQPKVAEQLDLLPDPSRTITALGFLIGKNTLLIGDSHGDVHAWFRHPTARRSSAQPTGDGTELVEARVFLGTGSAVTALSPSPRTRLFLAGHADGSLELLHGTSGRDVAALQLPGPVLQAIIAPKEDGILAADPAGVQLYSLQPGNPEVSLASIITPVWYEGYTAPEHAWQSTGGTDEFEPKYGLWPLVFGTLKATLYCLLLGVPIALLAALYTSEFLRPGLRAKVKPLLEMMASLPSVVLGFLAALVFAPWIEKALLPVLSLALCVPLVWMLAAQLFAALPPRLVPLAERWRLCGVALVLPLGIALALWGIGPWLEQWLFAGDLRHWLAAEQFPPGDPLRGSALGGWFLLLLPVTGILAMTGLGLWRGLRRGPWSGLVRLLVGVVLALGVSLLLGWLLARAGFDLRGTPDAHGLVGTYVQRNALIVGFAMAFAVIPIVFTIADDALAAVPAHLRAASLGAGATPWQTAVRIVLPTAMSGIFSAVMVGLGRAIGETMIVLMAAGNTPILDVNPFNGFRTLSANIAVELPEAVRDSTHYRMLYLAALVLFVLTFLLNTVAELVRQRFRKRAFQL